MFISVAMAFLSDWYIVVADGFAGMSTSNTVSENDDHFVLLDNTYVCRGNSTKATSAKNGANTRTLRDTGMRALADLFTSVDPSLVTRLG